jgi:hypothetical protein
MNDDLLRCRRPKMLATTSCNVLILSGISLGESCGESCKGQGRVVVLLVGTMPFKVYCGRLRVKVGATTRVTLVTQVLSLKRIVEHLSMASRNVVGTDDDSDPGSCCRVESN